MTLSFREEAALVYSRLGDETAAVGQAQKLADACCFAWGHAFAQDPKYYATVCTRCGYKTPEPRR